MSEHLVHLRRNWSRSRAFRVALIAAVAYAVLRLAVHAVYLAVLLSASEGDGGGMPNWAGAGGPMLPVDLQVYLDAAQRYATRHELYLSGPITRLEDLYQYAPPFAMLFVPFLWLPHWMNAALHTALHLVAYALLYAHWARTFNRLGLGRASEVLAWTLPVWLVFSAFWSDLSYLNVYIIMALLASLLTSAVMFERLGASLLWLVIILLIKPQWSFAAAIPLLLGRYRFFIKLLLLAIAAYLASAGLVLLVAGPAYGWQQYVHYISLLARLSQDFPWRGPAAGFLGYNHSIVQLVLYLSGTTPANLRAATAVKALLLLPLAAVVARNLLRPAHRRGFQLPQTSLELAFALYLGAFIWLDMVWEVSLGIVVFSYLLATLPGRRARRATWIVFLPYALVDFWQLVSVACFGMRIVAPGPYILTDLSIYVPTTMLVILAFHALLLGRLWKAVPACRGRATVAVGT